MEETFIRIAKGEYKLYFYRKGELDRTYEIAHGQDPVGPKRREGDRKVPEGEYRICQKAEGPFGDDYSWGPFFGPRWIKINYPNAFDARSGLTNKRITTKECDAILRAIDRGETPPQKTELGGGIGIHGWIPEGWSNEDSRNMTWGCISMHDPDLVELYDAVDVGTLVIITE